MAQRQIRSGGNDLVILPQALGVDHLALGIKKGETGMKKLVDDTLRELEASGEAQKLFDKWFGAASKLKMPARIFKIETDKLPGG